MTTTLSRTLNTETGTVGTEIPFDAIHEPGAYLCNWSGHLLRVPEDGISGSNAPIMSITAEEPLFVTKISEDPFIPVSRARMAVANLDVAGRF